MTKLVNDWLDATDLSSIIQQHSPVNPGDEYRVIIRSSDSKIRQLPWQLWTGWQQLNSPEIALSAPHGRRRDRTYQQQIRILIILGNSEGINLEIDRQLLTRYCQGADLHFIAQPTLTELREHLWTRTVYQNFSHSGQSSKSNSIVDRLEELYTLVQNDTRRQRFLDNILTAIDRLPSVKLVFTLRADFYDRILTDYALVTALERVKILNLTTMNRAELTAAIELPAHKLGVKFEDGLSERILDTIIDRPHSLPLLEFALTQLWAKQRDGKLTHRGYEAIGGVEQALANHSEAVYQQLTPTEQLQMRSIFLQLIQLNRQLTDRHLATSRLATKAEIGIENWTLVEHLVDVRLLVIDRDRRNDLETVELIHEALIKYWDRLNLWIEIDSDFRIWQEQLRSSIDRWHHSERDEASLIGGKSLAIAVSWYQQHPQKLSFPEQNFIDRSSTKQQQEATAKQRLQ